LLAPLKKAERELNREYTLELSIATHNFGAALTEDQWFEIEKDLQESDVVFVIHVMDGENASRLLALLETHGARHRAVVVINCMPDLMRRTRMGRLDLARLLGAGTINDEASRTVTPAGLSGRGPRQGAKPQSQIERSKTKGSVGVLRTVGSWIGNQAKARRDRNGQANGKGHTRYLKLADRLPGILRFIPGAGALGDVKNYLTLFCYFLQPTPANIQSMILYALKHYVPRKRLKQIKVKPPESMPSVAIYHPDSAALFESFDAYQKWYVRRVQKNGGAVNLAKKGGHSGSPLRAEGTIGLLLMRDMVSITA